MEQGGIFVVVQSGRCGVVIGVAQVGVAAENVERVKRVRGIDYIAHREQLWLRLPRNVGRHRLVLLVAFARVSNTYASRGQRVEAGGNSVVVDFFVIIFSVKQLQFCFCGELQQAAGIFVVDVLVAPIHIS